MPRGPYNYERHDTISKALTSEDPINITTPYPFIFLRKYPKLKSNHALTVSPSLPLRPGSPGGP